MLKFAKSSAGTSQLNSLATALAKAIASMDEIEDSLKLASKFGSLTGSKNFFANDATRSCVFDIVDDSVNYVSV